MKEENNMDFSKVVMEALANQLIRGYQVQNTYGGFNDVESPLQSMVRKWINDNSRIVTDEMAKILGTSSMKDEIASYVHKQLSSEYSLKSYQEKFVTHFKTVVEEEVVKDLRVLLAGKKITISIEE